jgi:type IV secretory pathway VirB4 component
MLPKNNDPFDKYRFEYNNMINSQLKKGRNDITKEKYITYTIKSDNLKDARSIFSSFDEKIITNFKRMGSSARVLTGTERAKTLHDILNLERENLFNCNIKQINKYGHITKDVLVPDSLKFKFNYFCIGDKFAKIIFLRDFPSYLNDCFIADITDFSFNMLLTINIKSVLPDKAIKLVKKQITGMEANKLEYQKRASKSGYSQDIVPYELKHSLNQAEDLLNELLNKNQKMFLTNLLIMITADTKDELNKKTDSILSCARKFLCYMGTLNYQQEDALKSILPIGTNKLKVQRTLTTDSTAVLIPFTSQNIFQKNGMYYGLNSISKNMVIFNRKSLKNSNGFILGTPGSGKSFAAKREMINVLLNTNDDVIILDPESEYENLVKNFNGEIIKLSANTNNYINPLDLNQNYSDDEDPISIKSEFILSLCEILLNSKNGLTSKEKTIIDRCLKKTYTRYLQNFDKSTTPTLLDFHEILESQPETEATDISLSLEIYTKGSLSIFSKKSNVNYNNRFVSYNIKDLGNQLKTIGMLIVLDNIWNRITQNRQIGKRTWLYMDEAHLLFKNDYSANFIHELYKRARKWGCIPTSITQNVSEILQSNQAKTMTSNSDFLLIFNQSASDREELSKLLKISDTQISYVTNSQAGQGLLYTGEFTIPFFDNFPKHLNLYNMMTTKPDEIIKI